jgi:HopA1 effector protein family
MPQQSEGLEEQLRQILSEIRILSPECFVFAGERVNVATPASQAASSLAQNSTLVLQLQEYLYQRCYCVAFGSGMAAQKQPASGAEEFLGQLSRANLSVSRWDANWRVLQVENTGKVWAEKGGVMRIFQPGEFVNFADAGSPVRVGSAVSVYIFRESTTFQPGLYFAFGETVTSSDNLDLFRLYWNIHAPGVLSLLRLISRDLNRFQVPFQFKSPVLPQGYARRDAAVLYLKKRFHALVRELAAAWSQECSSQLRDGVPLFTLPLARGLGLAEDPETGESFGMNRCRHLAEAVWNAHIRSLPETQHLHAVKEQFEQHGLDFSRPYLNAGSVDLYTAETHA